MMEEAHVHQICESSTNDPSLSNSMHNSSHFLQLVANRTLKESWKVLVRRHSMLHIKNRLWKPEISFPAGASEGSRDEINIPANRQALPRKKDVVLDFTNVHSSDLARSQMGAVDMYLFSWLINVLNPKYNAHGGSFT